MILVFSFVIALQALAVPQYINYQGVLRDSVGDLVTGTKSMVFNLYDVSTGGSAVWTMTSAEVTVSNGLYTVQLGPITSADIGSGDRWLEVAVAGTTLTPRLKILSVAYAITADTAAYATLSGTASSAADAQLLDGYNTGVSGLSIIPTTDATGKLSTAVIPTSGLTYDLAAYATLSGTASTAATVSDGVITTAKIAADAVTSAKIADGAIDNSAKIVAGVIQGSDLAGGININTTGAVTCDATTTNTLTIGNASVGTATCPAGGDGVTVGNTTVTANSIILISIGPSETADDALKISDITPGVSFKVMAADNISSTELPFRYVIIN